MLATGMHSRGLNSKHRQPQSPCPHPSGCGHHMTSLPPTRSLQKQSLVHPARFGMEKNGVGGKSRLRTTIQRTQAMFRLREMTTAQAKPTEARLCHCPGARGQGGGWQETLGVPSIPCGQGRSRGAAHSTSPGRFMSLPHPANVSVLKCLQTLSGKPWR